MPVRALGLPENCGADPHEPAIEFRCPSETDYESRAKRATSRSGYSINDAVLK